MAGGEAGEPYGGTEGHEPEESGMQEDTAPPRVGRDVLVAH